MTYETPELLTSVKTSAVLAQVFGAESFDDGEEDGEKQAEESAETAAGESGD